MAKEHEGSGNPRPRPVSASQRFSELQSSREASGNVRVGVSNLLRQTGGAPVGKVRGPTGAQHLAYSRCSLSAQACTVL